MRVINHKQKQSKKWSPRVTVLAFLSVIAAVTIFLVVDRDEASAPEASKQQTSTKSINTAAKKKDGALKTFTPAQFQELSETISYPNTQKIDEDTPITGNEAADTKIRQLAVSRGYKIKSAPVSDTFKAVEQTFELQQRAAVGWEELKASAAKEGINLGLTAGYRSAVDQKAIFLQRLGAQNVTAEAIAAGTADAQVVQVLRTTAIPGYSRHHTGYTVDISCENQPASSFMFTVCFKWLEANNYEHTKLAGWIPSYPDGASQQGPEPESWEYVWVGKSIVRE